MNNSEIDATAKSSLRSHFPLPTWPLMQTDDTSTAARSRRPDTTTTPSLSPVPLHQASSSSLPAWIVSSDSESSVGVGGLVVAPFLPDFTEHPKPKREKPRAVGVGSDNNSNTPSGSQDDPRIPPKQATAEEAATLGEDITFFHDFVAGGVAGSASVVVGHPFDTLKVRLQTSTGASTNIWHSIREFGGISTLFRGMAAPLASAAIVNAVIFGSYGFSSRLYDQYVVSPQPVVLNDSYAEGGVTPTHDPWQKALLCGSFAGFVQCFIVCPMEHVKCRLQIQQGTNAAFHGPLQTTRQIVSKYGVQRLFQGWWSTVMREVPAFGLYFAVYDFLKDRTNTLLVERDRRLLEQQQERTTSNADLSVGGEKTTHTWVASAIAGGCSGSFTWAIVYPVDLIKSKIQTAPLDTPFRQLSMWNVGRDIVRQHGVRFLFRGLGITLIRAFPVNGTIFPVYEFTLKQISDLGY